ncbi:putative acetyltransferase YhhY [Variovorax sp. PBL-H6]|uniref:GNAT family N-acetyltransferase n=1 Tax=Variovorax sp. PBL-H6 TaxID=434009 RepID=UPI001317911E|nr:GNAT family protein [Variovorax sp. PBL-H6]VTU29655.1 putative acetyltransferase YhhY [Variovorax sp. PBL-H6]
MAVADQEPPPCPTAVPDGYTIGMGTSTALTSAPHLIKSPGYDVERSFTYLGLRHRARCKPLGSSPVTIASRSNIHCIQMNLSIEPIAKQHFEGLRRALDTVARERRFLAFTEAPPEDDCRAFHSSIIANGWCQMVAILDGVVVGWCDVLPTHGQARSHVGTLGIGLIPPARRHGFGEKLMKSAIDAAWETGLTRIELTVRVDNANAKALYERVGFKVEGLQRRSFRVDGEYADSYSMALLRES